MSSISIHRANFSELDAAYDLVCEYYEAIGVILRDEKEAFEQEYFTAGTGVWLARSNQEIAGCIVLRALLHLERSAEIKRLYVRPAYRKQGIAKLLLKALEDYAIKHDYSTLYLDTNDDLPVALRFYQRHGYQPCERYNDNPQATIFLRKQLSTIDACTP